MSNGGVLTSHIKTKYPAVAKITLRLIVGWTTKRRMAIGFGQQKMRPSVTFGQGDIIAKTVEAPAYANIVRAIVFNSLWHTNFVDNAMGRWISALI